MYGQREEVNASTTHCWKTHESRLECFVRRKVSLIYARSISPQRNNIESRVEYRRASKEARLLSAYLMLQPNEAVKRVDDRFQNSQPLH